LISLDNVTKDYNNGAVVAVDDAGKVIGAVRGTDILAAVRSQRRG
jgi:CBS-domain-containing membrane protein